MSKLTDQARLQRAYALAHPCRLAEECEDQRYFFGGRVTQSVSVSIGLTVNVGQE